MSKKKILYLSQLYPYPLDSGGKIKSFNTLKALAPHYDIFATFISEEKPKPKDIKYLKNKGIKYIKVFYSDQILASVKDDYSNLIWNFIRGVPHYVFQYTYPPAFPFIKGVINKIQPNIIHVDHLNLAQYLPKKKRQIWILEHHNVETYLYWTRFIHSHKLTRKLYLFMEMVLTFIFEWKSLRKFNHIFTISQPETERTKTIFRVNNVSAQPFVYPIQNIKRKFSSRPKILFIGNLGWPPNEDAVEWFIKEILPQITKKVPSVEFHIVGKRQPMYEKYWPKPKNLILHGYQKSLIPFLSKAHIFVMPFRMGGGMRIKSLTALSADLPLVATPLGVEGLKVKHNKQCLIANSSQEFAESVVKLLNNKKLQQKLRKNAQKYMKEYHGESLNKGFLREYKSIISHN